jgi:hypothetical protein
LLYGEYIHLKKKRKENEIAMLVKNFK